jgi:hypothetical protein
MEFTETAMRGSPMIRTTAAALLLISSILLIPETAGAHCAPAHRHFRGRVYFLTCNEYSAPVWCDSCGNSLWSYNDRGKITKVRAKRTIQTEETVSARVD